jgi:hypothetical protein
MELKMEKTAVFLIFFDLSLSKETKSPSNRS